MNAFAKVFAQNEPMMPRHAADSGPAAPWTGWPGTLPGHGFIVDLLPQAVLLVQQDRAVLAANPVARRLMDEGAIHRDEGRLTQLGQLRTLQLSRLLTQAATGSVPDCAVWFGRSLTTGLLHLSRVKQQVAELPGFPSNPQLLLVVQLDQPMLTQSARIDALVQKCRLSPAERHVLLLLADGEPVEAASRHLGLCVSTVRSHVRNLLGKTQAPSLMQLLRWTGSAKSLLQ